MIKLVLIGELAFFLVAGLHIVIHETDKARAEGIASVLVALPLKSLSDISV